MMLAEDPQPPRLHTHAHRFVDELLAWMAAAGASRYDESVTQMEHALQSAALAGERGQAPTLVIAALLHDVGHLLADEHDGHGDFLQRDLKHERIGARWLARAFDVDVTEPIALHVDAKRCICGADPDYFATLSESSRRSLRVQGGPMSVAEIEQFKVRPFAEQAIELRRIDDLAKRAGYEVEPAVHSRELLIRHVRSVAA